MWNHDVFGDLRVKAQDILGRIKRLEGMMRRVLI